MEAASTSATLVNFYQTTWCQNPEDSHILSLPPFIYLKTETGPVSETLCLDKIKMMDNVHNNSYAHCNRPSETFKLPENC
jgi:hypothetical protein